jgi:hypothetical protein
MHESGQPSYSRPELRVIGSLTSVTRSLEGGGLHFSSALVGSVVPTPTAEPTPTATAEPTPTATAEPTPTATAEPTPTGTPTPTVSPGGVGTPVPTPDIPGGSGPTPTPTQGTGGFVGTPTPTPGAEATPTGANEVLTDKQSGGDGRGSDTVGVVQGSDGGGGLPFTGGHVGPIAAVGAALAAAGATLRRRLRRD